MLESELIHRFPFLFHMTNGRAWPQIQKYGLLSPKAIYEMQGKPPDELRWLLRSYRPEEVAVADFLLRDQKPLRLHNLQRNLDGSNLTIGDWLELLNERVFFSTHAKYTAKLRSSYSSESVTIIVIDTAKLIASHRAEIELCKYNSGAARMPQHKKSRECFQSIEQFSFSAKNQPKELTVLNSVRNLTDLLVDIIQLPPNEPFRSPSDDK